MINLDNIKIYKEPYTYFTIENAFSNTDFNNMVSEFPTDAEFETSKIVMGGRERVSNVGTPTEFDAYIKKSPTWKKFYNYLNSPNMIQDIFPLFIEDLKQYGSRLNLENLDIDINGGRSYDFNLAGWELNSTGKNKDQDSLWVELDISRAFDGYKREIHHDMHYRVLNLLAFFSEGDGDGGEFRIHGESNNIDMADHSRQPAGHKTIDDDKYPVAKSIKPQKNLLIGFLNTPNSYHSVSELINSKKYRDFIYVGISTKGAMAFHKNKID